MFSEAYCAAVNGIDGSIVRAECDVSHGLPGFQIVGYLSAEVKETRERVWAAIKNSGFFLRPEKILVNLSPADMRKDGTEYDLAVAAAVISSYGIIPNEYLKDKIFIGELTLDGRVLPVNGVLPMVYAAMQEGFSYAYVPVENLNEALAVKGIRVIPVTDIKNLIEITNDPEKYTARDLPDIPGITAHKRPSLDFKDVRGQEAARRAVEAAVSGMHNILMIGPPGSGKTMIAERIPGIMPVPDFDELMKISKVYSVTGLLSDDAPLITERPFRSPHHTITTAALIGGGIKPRPGEVSLASGGVLFLDELPEFSLSSIEVLRQPLEDGLAHISRNGGSYTYPADFQLVAAMNPCKCGYFPSRRCSCTPGSVRRYLNHVSRPLLDRIDICTETFQMDFKSIRDDPLDVPESSDEIRMRVEAVQEIQRERYKDEDFSYNSRLTPSSIKKYCALTPLASDYLSEVFDREFLTNRSYHKILKVARTIADMDGADKINEVHISEAVCYRSADRNYWNNPVLGGGAA
jgi:magnesium chelatase family protein